MEPQNHKALNDQHDKAMEYAGLADLARIRGDKAESMRLYLQAYEMERDVALQIAETTLEPSRSVLLLSAASLAFLCDKYLEAEKLIVEALHGNPQPYFAEQLRDLWRQVIDAMREKTAGD